MVLNLALRPWSMHNLVLSLLTASNIGVTLSFAGPLADGGMAALPPVSRCDGLSAVASRVSMTTLLNQLSTLIRCAENLDRPCFLIGLPVLPQSDHHTAEYARA